jgi:hypothetical protein
MLDKFSTLPLGTVSKIRHMRIGGRDLKLSWPGESHEDFYRTSWVLKLLPGLQLDTLTVLGPVRGHASYEIMSELIQHGTGWRELHFITPTSNILRFKIVNFYADVPPIWRETQHLGSVQKMLPNTWTLGRGSDLFRYLELPDEDGICW